MSVLLTLLFSNLVATAQTSTRVVLATTTGAQLLIEVETPTTLQYLRCRYPDAAADPNVVVAKGLCRAVGPTIVNAPDVRARLQTLLSARLMWVVAELNLESDPHPLSYVLTGVGIGGVLVQLMPSSMFSMTQRILISGASGVTAGVLRKLMVELGAPELKRAIAALDELDRHRLITNDVRGVAIEGGLDEHDFAALDRSQRVFDGRVDVFAIYGRALAHSVAIVRGQPGGANESADDIRYISPVVN